MDMLSTLADLLGLKGLLIIVLIFVPLERILALHPRQPIFRRGWGNDLVYFLVNGWLIKAGLVVIVIGTLILTEWLVPSFFRDAVAAQPLWLQILQVFILAGLGFYAPHRLFHAVPWLWRFHQIHHSIEELDWLAAARVHPVDQIITK